MEGKGVLTLVFLSCLSCLPTCQNSSPIAWAIRFMQLGNSVVLAGLACLLSQKKLVYLSACLNVFPSACSFPKSLSSSSSSSSASLSSPLRFSFPELPFSSCHSFIHSLTHSLINIINHDRAHAHAHAHAHAPQPSFVRTPTTRQDKRSNNAQDGRYVSDVSVKRESRFLPFFVTFIHLLACVCVSLSLFLWFQGISFRISSPSSSLHRPTNQTHQHLYLLPSTPIHPLHSCPPAFLPSTPHAHMHTWIHATDTGLTHTTHPNPPSHNPYAVFLANASERERAR